VAIGFDYLPGGWRMSSHKTLKRYFPAEMLTGLALLATTALGNAQYPGQIAKPDKDTQQMRAVAVLEWTGDETHPKTSRLIPVCVYDGQDLQDAGIYLARPAPLALMSEVEYELKNNGKTVGLFDVSSAGQQYGSWIGFGVWKPLPKPKPAMQAAAPTGKDIWGNNDDGDRPVLHRKQHDDDSTKSGSDGKNGDSDRPTLHKKNSDDPGSDASTNSPAPDPDRPTLHKKASDDSGGDPSSNTAPDPDRPTLHKKSTDDASGDSSSAQAPDPDRPTLKKQKTNNAKKVDDVGFVESVARATDPDRPRLLRGKPAEIAGDVLPTLKGLPQDMHQAVAVSDARNRPEHVWSYSWANPEDEGKMKGAMEDLARKALGVATAPPPAPAPAVKAGTKKTAASQKTRLTLPAEPAPLFDEQFRVFELAYGAGATMVLSARTDGDGATMKFVTLICQTDLYGNVIVLLKNVTDAAHLDDAPRMRLVDAVDVLADNRGELLFELRGATERQFALYRVLRGQVNKLFVSGPAAIGPAAAGSGNS
jgi:hypothetical protein